MSWILWVLAIFGIIAFLILGYLYFKIIHPIRKAMKAVKDVTGMSMLDMGSSPLLGMVSYFPDYDSYISPVGKVIWNAKKEISSSVEEYEALGFEKVGGYYGIPNYMQAEVLIHPSGSILCIGETEDELSVKCFMLGIFDDDSCIYVGSNEPSSIFPVPVNETRIERNSERASRILEDFEDLRAERELKKLTSSNFIEELQQMEKRRCWQIASNPEEIEDVIKGMDSENNMLAQTLRQSLSDLITECCRQHYLSSANHTAVEWERMRDFLVVVHDRSLSGSVLQEEYDDEADLKSLDYKQLLENSYQPMTREAYKDKIATYLEVSRPEYLASIAEPVPADIYLQKS